MGAHPIMKFLVCCISGLIFAVSARPASSSGSGPQHYVFAHYMLCFPTYGESVAAYKREIQEAQVTGIDGFVLDVGAWSDPSFMNYNRRVPLMYDAAEQLGTGFKLMFFVEFSNPTNIMNLVETFANRTNTFRYQGGIVLSAWGMNNVPSLGWVGVDWTNTVLNPLRDAGCPVFFIPHFWPPNAHELPTYSDAEFLLNQDGSFIQGLFLACCSVEPQGMMTTAFSLTAAPISVRRISAYKTFFMDVLAF